MSISPQSSCSKTRCWTSSPLQLARRSEPSGHWAALVKATLTIAAINQWTTSITKHGLARPFASHRPSFCGAFLHLVTKRGANPGSAPHRRVTQTVTRGVTSAIDVEGDWQRWKIEKSRPLLSSVSIRRLACRRGDCDVCHTKMLRSAAMPVT